MHSETTQGLNYRHSTSQIRQEALPTKADMEKGVMWQAPEANLKLIMPPWSPLEQAINWKF